MVAMATAQTTTKLANLVLTIYNWSYRKVYIWHKMFLAIFPTISQNIFRQIDFCANFFSLIILGHSFCHFFASPGDKNI